MKRAASDEEKNINSNSLKRPRMQSRFERLILSGKPKKFISSFTIFNLQVVRFFKR